LPTKFHLGVDNCFARKRWPRPNEWAEIMEKRFKCKHLEFTGDLLDPQTFPMTAMPRLAAEVKKAAADHGISIYDYYTGVITHCLNLLSHPDDEVRAFGFKWCEDAIRITKAIGARGIGGHYDTIAETDWADPKMYAKCIDRLVKSFQKLSRVAKKEGIEFIMLEQMYTPLEAPYTIQQTHEMIDAINADVACPVYVTVDVGHMCCQNFPHTPRDRDPYEWLKEFGAVSPVIHIQQVDGNGSPHWPFTKECNAKGIIDPKKVMQALEASGSKENYLILEIFHSLAVPGEKVISDIEASVDYWRQFVTE
jgi:D-erythrulose 1-phosphate 3-epimerase